MKTFSFQIVLADMPRDKEEKSEYQREVLSDLQRIAEDLVAEITNHRVLFGDLITVNNVSLEPFLEEFQHTLTGWTVSLDLLVPYYWDACSIPAEWNTFFEGGSSGGESNIFNFAMSIQDTNGQVTLVNDEENPLPNYYYGTNGAGVRGWYLTTDNIGLTCETIGDCQTIIDIEAAIDALEEEILLKADISSISAVGFSNDYNDLDNKPTIPAAQVNSDWNAVSGVAEILNKPTLTNGTVTSVGVTAGTGISVSGSPITSSGSITVTNSAPDQVVGLTAGSGIAVTGTYPNFTITNNAPSGGTVTAVTATAPMSSTGGATPNLSMSSANGTTNGYLLSSDWLIFNGKFNTPSGTTLQYVRGDGSLATFPTTLPPTGAAGGDLQGNYPNPTVHRVHGVDFQSGAPAVDDTWIYVSTPLGPQPFQWQHSKLKTSQVQNDSTVTGTNADDALEHLDSTKQATLVSGTNIKTVNSTTLLGSGNIAVEPTITAGTTGQYYRGDKTFQTLDKTAVGLANVDNTSDANKPVSSATQTALNAKQDTLTLTTTGTSGAATLTGATLNIPQYSGGGGAFGVHTFLPLPSGGVTSAVRISINPLSSTNFTANRLVAYPFIPAQSFTASTLSINVNSATAGSLCRIAIYSDLNGYPNSRLFVSSDLDCSTTGQKTALTTFNFVAGTIYWLAFHGGATASSLSCILQAQSIPLRMNTLTSVANSVFYSLTFATPTPATFAAGSSFISQNLQYIGITKA
jgi:hypothetical protein